MRTLIAFTACMLLCGCASQLEVFADRQGSAAPIVGVPFHGPELYVREGIFKQAAKGGDCDPAPFVEIETLPLGPLYFANIKAAELAKSGFVMKFNDKGALSEISMNTEPSSGELLKNTGELIKAIAPLAGIAAAPPAPGARPACDAGPHGSEIYPLCGLAEGAPLMDRLIIRRLLLTAILAAVSGCGSANRDAEPDRTGDANHANEVSAAQQVSAPDQLLPYDPASVPGMARIQDKSYVLRAALWSNPNIAVCWESVGNAPERQMVRDAVQKSWEANSVVRFFGWGQCAANARGIRISVQDAGPHTKGLGNQLDAKPQGMVLNFTFANWSTPCAASAAARESCIRSIAVHEFGHALAFAHEQNRPDTPGECTQKPQGSNGDLMLTPWDLHSVMNYCNPVYNNDGKLSPLDIVTLKAVYR